MIWLIVAAVVLVLIAVIAIFLWMRAHPRSPGGPPMPHDPRLDGIDHLVVLMMENRSFDHFMGARKVIEGRTVEGLTGTETNPDDSGTPVQVFSMPELYPEPPAHEWGPAHEQWNLGQNDGFVHVQQHLHPSRPNEVMGYYSRDKLPVLYELADAYTTCDHWFSSVLGSTWPNRFYLHAATSGGQTTNLPEPLLDTVWDQLAAAGVPATNYYTDAAWMWGGLLRWEHTRHIDEFFDDAASGQLPAFSLIDPGFFTSSDHPPQDIQLGQALMSTIYGALAASPAWPRTLLVIIYDEHGGFYDHVPPPKAPADKRPRFRQLGFRVPAVVVGGAVRAGYVDSTVYDHVSIPATLGSRFGLKALNQRMATTAHLGNTIDPALLSSPRSPVPLTMLALSVSNIVAGLPRGAAAEEELWAVLDHVDIGLPSGKDRRRQEEDVIRQLLARGEQLRVLRLDP